jgi:hypothetical protein
MPHSIKLHTGFCTLSANTGLIILTLCFLGCAAEKPYDHEPIQSIKAGVIYRRGDGREAIQCQGGRVPSMCGSVEINAEQIYYDCSDERFECLFNAADVLAIPKTGLTLGQQYAVFGANLTVERCFGNQASCEVALIKSECTDARTCSCRSSVRGRTMKFYFSRELGVTTFYTTSDVSLIGVDSKMLEDTIPLMTYVLVAEKGFLRTPLALRRATSDTNCRN